MRRGIRSGSKLIESRDMAQDALESASDFAFAPPPLAFPRRRRRLVGRRVGAMSDATVRIGTRVRTSCAWEYRHRRFMVPVRIGIGIWLVVLTAILYGRGRGGARRGILSGSKLIESLDIAQGALESASDSLHARAEWASTCCGVSGDANPVSRQRVAVPRLLPRAGGGHERERTSPVRGLCRGPDDARSPPPRSDRAEIHARRPSARGSGCAHRHRAPRRSAPVWRGFPTAP